jgi:hypothetical protein
MRQARTSPFLALRFEGVVDTESVSYLLLASVGPMENTYSPTSVSMLLKKNAVTDSINFSGQPFSIPRSGNRYIPSLLITPETPALTGN